MNAKNERGFSLIELLIVVVIIGIIAAMAIPALQKATRAAENRATWAAMRIISSTQLTFFSQNARFGTIPEVNTIVTSLGTTVGDEMVRGKFTYAMVPPTPTPAELKNEFTITATKVIEDGTIYQYQITQTGVIERLQPGAENDL